MDEDNRLGPERWEKRWREGETPWDAGEPARALVALIESGVLPMGRALVVGSGSGYDAIALAKAGWETTALDFAPSASAQMRALRDREAVEEGRLRAVVADFFSYRPDAPYDLVWDYTFLCAIAPGRREEWAECMGRLVAKKGELATLLFPVPGNYVQEEGGEGGTLVEPGDGPPFHLAPHDVRRWLRPSFEEILLAPCAAGHPARLGRQWLGRWRRKRS